MTDLAGHALFISWPHGTPIALRAHGDAGAAAAVGGDLATSGGWDPEVIRWSQTGERRWTARPVEGRVTALCAQGDDLLVAGADRAPADAEGGGDRTSLGPGRVARIAADGTVSAPLATAVGEIAALACGQGWLAYLDRSDGSVHTVAGGRHEPVALDGAATAVAAEDDTLYVADAGGIAAIAMASGERRALTGPDPHELTTLALLPLGDAILRATSEGITLWPGAAPVGEPGRQPAALARHGEGALVLWPDGCLDELAADGAVVREVQIPFGD